MIIVAYRSARRDDNTGWHGLAMPSRSVLPLPCNIVLTWDRVVWLKMRLVWWGAHVHLCSLQCCGMCWAGAFGWKWLVSRIDEVARGRRWRGMGGPSWRLI